MVVFSFDVGGTLVDDAKGINDFWFRVIPQELAKKNGIGFEEALKLCKKEYESHKEKFGRDNNWYDPNFWVRKFKINKSLVNLISKVKDEIKIFDDVEGALNLIKGYRKIIVTNHSVEIVKFELRDYITEFDAIYSSHENEAFKSNVALWKRIVRDVNVSPKEIIHIGDNYLHDYLVPISVGIKAYLLSRKYTNLTQIVKIALRGLEYEV